MKKITIMILFIVMLLCGCSNRDSSYDMINYEKITQISVSDECVKSFMKSNHDLINKKYNFKSKSNTENSYTDKLKNKLLSNDYTFRHYILVNDNVDYRECIVHKNYFKARYGAFYFNDNTPAINPKEGDGLYSEQIYVNNIFYEKDFESNDFKVVENATSFKDAGVLYDFLNGTFVEQYVITIEDKIYFAEKVKINNETIREFIYDKKGNLIACDYDDSQNLVSGIFSVDLNENNKILPPC